MRKTVKNAFKICYSKRQCVSASGGLPSPDPLACAVLKFPLKIPRLCVHNNSCLVCCYDSAAADATNTRQHRQRMFPGVCRKILSHVVSFAELSSVGCGRSEQCQHSAAVR